MLYVIYEQAKLVEKETRLAYSALVAAADVLRHAPTYCGTFPVAMIVRYSKFGGDFSNRPFFKTLPHNNCVLA
jgi:hypothetical protein